MADVPPEKVTEASGWLQGLYIDARSLAATRILTATCLLVHFVDRFRDLTEHYTEAGALPRGVAARVGAETVNPVADSLDNFDAFFNSSAPRLSLNMLSGSFGLQAVLATLAIVAAIALLVGFKIRGSALVGFFLCLSFESRNYLNYYPGDPVLRMLLLWLALLPASGRWCVGTGGGKGRIFSPVTAAYSIYFAYFLLLVGLRKTGQSWLDGTAIHYMLGNRSFATGYGDWLLETPQLTMGLTYLTIATEVTCPLALLAFARSSRVRLGAVVLVVCLMVSIRLTLQVYVLPLLVASAFVAFLPSSFWDALEGWVPRIRYRSGQVALDSSPKPPSPKERIFGVIAIAILVISMTVDTGRAALISYDFAYLQPPRSMLYVADLLRISTWSVMFRDPAVVVDGWPVIVGETREGRRFDLLTGAPPTFEQPKDTRALYGSFRSWRYLRSATIMAKPNTPLNRAVVEGYAAFLCQSWNGRHVGGEHLEKVDVLSMVMRAPKPGERAQLPTRRSHGAFSCLSAATVP